MTERSTAVRPGRTAADRKSRGQRGAARAGGSGPQGAALDPGEFAHIRASLDERLQELRAEHKNAMTELLILQRERQSDSSGDDQADAGTKTFEREQELTLAHGILERIDQVERAIARIDEGHYGQCERCGNQIPIARLEAFPSATLCVECKQRQERR